MLMDRTPLYSTTMAPLRMNRVIATCFFLISSFKMKKLKIIEYIGSTWSRMEEFIPLVMVEPKKKVTDVAKVPKNPIGKRYRRSFLENSCLSSFLNFRMMSMNPDPIRALIAAKNTGFMKPTPYLVITGKSPDKKISVIAKMVPFCSVSSLFTGFTFF